MERVTVKLSRAEKRKPSERSDTSGIIGRPGSLGRENDRARWSVESRDSSVPPVPAPASVITSTAWPMSLDSATILRKTARCDVYLAYRRSRVSRMNERRIVRLARSLAFHRSLLPMPIASPRIGSPPRREFRSAQIARRCETLILRVLFPSLTPPATLLPLSLSIDRNFP